MIAMQDVCIDESANQEAARLQIFISEIGEIVS
jgi:hypothetical protein